MMSLMFNRFRLVFFICVAVLYSTSYPAAQSNTSREYTTFDSEAITVSTTAVGFTATKINPAASPRKARLATFTVECSTTSPCPIRFLTSGATPTASVGQTLNAGDSVRIYGYDDIAAFLAIRSGANDAKLQAQYAR